MDLMNNSSILLKDYSLCTVDQDQEMFNKAVKSLHLNEQPPKESNLPGSNKRSNETNVLSLNKPNKTSLLTAVSATSEDELTSAELFYSDANNETTTNSMYMNDMVDDSAMFTRRDEIEIYDRNTPNGKGTEAEYENNSASTNTTANTASNLIEIETVKNKLSSIWNNVKYGWASYLKKPAKISLDKLSGPVFILGKKYNPNNPYERPILTNPLTNVAGEMNHYDLVDRYESLNESFINPSIPILRTNSNTHQHNNHYHHPYSPQSLNEDDLSLNFKQIYSINNTDCLSSSSSASLSTSPLYLNNIMNKNNKTKSDPAYYLVDERKKNKLKTMTALSDYYLQPQVDSEMKSHLEKELHSRLWFTYRKDFQPINGNPKYTSDCGWGCMLRSAQMLIAQAFLLHFFGKDWSLYRKFKTSEYNLYKEVISWFNDRPSRYCPFGLHRLLEIADQKSIGNVNEPSNSRVGSWFGPNSVCLLMKEALGESIEINPLLDQIKIYVAQDCTIYKQDVIDLCFNSITNEFKPCIILVSVRLGGEELNDMYVSSLKKFLEMDICIGIIGGKPKHSLYFMGYQGDKVIYLDPHFCQPTTNIYSDNDPAFVPNNVSPVSSLSSSKYSYDDNISSSDYEIFENSTYHCENPSKIPFNKLDPSLAIGFYCATLKEVHSLCDFVKMTPSFDNIFPVFGVCDESFNTVQLNYQLCSVDEQTKSKSPNQRRSSRNISISDSLSTSPGYQITHHHNNNINSSNNSHHHHHHHHQHKSTYHRSHTTERKSKVSSFLPERLTSRLGKTLLLAGSGTSNTKTKNSTAASSSLTPGKSKRKPSCNDSDDFVLV